MKDKLIIESCITIATIENTIRQCFQDDNDYSKQLASEYRNAQKEEIEHLKKLVLNFSNN